MKQILILIVGLAFLLCSCKKERRIGEWDDNIQLSQRNVTLNANGDSAIITTIGTWWWLTNVSFNGAYKELRDTNASTNFFFDTTFYKVERRGNNIIFIAMSENNTGHQNKLTIGVEAGDYFDGVTVVQPAK